MAYTDPVGRENNSMLYITELAEAESTRPHPPSHRPGGIAPHAQRDGVAIVPPCGAAPLPPETIPAATRIDDGERSLTGDRQEVLVSRDQQIGIAIDRRRKHPPVIRIANGKR